MKSALLASALLFGGARAISTECVEGDAVCNANGGGALLQLHRNEGVEGHSVPKDAKKLEMAEKASSERTAATWWWHRRRKPAPTPAPPPTVLQFPPEDIQQALVMGTNDNIGAGVPGFSSDVMDLTGYWYLKWNPESHDIYRSLRLEIAATFADARIEGYTAPDQPFKLKLFGQLGKHWGYSSSLPSSQQMFAHAVDWEICHALTFNMVNTTYGMIGGIGKFIKVNENQWSRPTELYGTTHTYLLSRIMKADGTKTEHWADYASLMSGYKLKVWNDDTSKLQRCKATALIPFACNWAGYSNDPPTCDLDNAPEHQGNRFLG